MHFVAMTIWVSPWTRFFRCVSRRSRLTGTDGEPLVEVAHLTQPTVEQQKMLDRLDVSLNQIGRLAESYVQGEDRAICSMCR